jgi:hypothetical protein
MWPVIYAILRSNAVYITLPIAGKLSWNAEMLKISFNNKYHFTFMYIFIYIILGVVGFIGYNIENLLSDKYTPFSSKYSSKI